MAQPLRSLTRTRIAPHTDTIVWRGCLSRRLAWARREFSFHFAQGSFLFQRLGAQKLFRRPAVVLSDFLDPEGYEPGLTALVGRGFQVDLVQILAPEELAPSTFGDLRLVDSETGGTQEVTFGKYRLRAYQQTVQNYIQRLREYCQARGINFFSAGSNTSLEVLLLKQLRQAEVWG